MTYYEELGLSPTASAEQIRHCYKALAKLLHPDQIQDNNQKRLAELQMRRLNEILAVLTDVERRRRYDAELEARREPLRRRAAAVQIPRHVRRAPRPLIVGLCAWGLPLLALLVFLSLLMTDGAGARSVPPAAAASATGFDVSAVHESDPPRNEPRKMPPALLTEAGIDRDKLLARLRTAEAQLVSLRAEQQSTLEELALAARPASREEPLLTPMPRIIARPAAEARPPLPVRTRDVGFAGHWYYVPTLRQHVSNEIYPPEYIELHISEDAGVLRGRYEARYRVTDQAIEPEVSFRFEGAAANSPGAQFPWTGPGESKGNVVLRLISTDQLEVTWSASQLSADLNLASGNAQLFRQREP